MDRPDVSVLIPTYNREGELRRTLESLLRADRGGLELQIVVIDNNSTDSTARVVASFEKDVPLQYLFEPRPGKNCALNRALEETVLGRIVVFIDDDVDVDRLWLRSVVQACDRYPDIGVFGGKITALWPSEKLPPWTDDPSIRSFCYSIQDLGEGDRLFEPPLVPFGPNLWIRREVFADGRRFDESIGPRPTDRIMGSETSLLNRLRAEGYEMLYWPDAAVAHRIQPVLLTARGVRRKAFWFGRHLPHVKGLCRRELLERHAALWYLLRAISLFRGALLYLASAWLPLPRPRVLGTVLATQIVAFNLESIRLARKRARVRDSDSKS